MRSALLLALAAPLIAVAAEVNGVQYDVPAGYLSGRDLLAQCADQRMDPKGRRCRQINELFEGFGGLDVWAFEIVVLEHPQGYHPVATLAMEPAGDISDADYLDSIYQQFEEGAQPGAPPLSEERSRYDGFQRMAVNNAYGAPGVVMTYWVRSQDGQRLIALLPSAPQQPPINSIPESIEWSASSDESRQ